jgi:PIN domain nuclease of toxin-antitoxin system
MFNVISSDPFDRLLVMQAKLNDLFIITRNAAIPDYPVVTITA